LTHGSACIRLGDAMQKLQPSSFKRVLRRMRVICIGMCIVLVSAAPSVSWGARHCSSEPGRQVQAEAHQKVAHACCCGTASSCVCDVKGQDSPLHADLALSSPQNEQRPILSGYVLADSCAIPDYLDSKMPSESFIFARAPATIYLLKRTLLC
jgi:hypothetical protein